MKKLLLFGFLLAGGLAAARRLRGMRADEHLWHEATTAPDLR